MAKIKKQTAQQILLLLPRVHITGQEASALMAIVQELREAVTIEEQAELIKDGQATYDSSLPSEMSSGHP